MKAMIVAAGFAAVATGTFATPAQADDINPWKHCGIGAMIFDDNTTAAAISNVIWDSGTTAITSATISPDTCNSQEVNVAQFIDTTYDVLVTETAQGRGEHLSAALNLVGCEANSQQVTELQKGLREDLSDSNFTSSEHADKAYSYYQTLQQTAVACG